LHLLPLCRIVSLLLFISCLTNEIPSTIRSNWHRFLSIHYRCRFFIYFVRLP
jgi:hypothetical protein